MGQGTVGLRFNIDTSQAKTQVTDLSKTIVGLNEEIRKATEAKDWRSVAMLTKSLDDTTSARSGIMKQAQEVHGAQARQNIQSGGIFGGQSAWMLQTALNQITRGIIQSMDAALSAARQRASGDYSGAAVTQQRAHGEIAGQAAGTVVGALGFLGGPALGALLMGLGGELGRFVGGIGSRKTETDLAYASQYKNALPTIDTLNQLYGGAINQKSGEENNRYGLEMHGRAATASEGTGLTTQAIIEAMKQTGGYGIRSETQALNMVQTQGLWSRFTGTDLATIQKYAGQSYRFGGDIGAVSTAYGGLMAQNMGKGQFSEFLNSMERILEEGIAKGFVRSSGEIAGNMAMLYKLSGGSSLWQGEQGAQRLGQMNAAIANATNLQSVEDVVSFGIARELLGEGDERRANFLRLGGEGKYYTGTYADEMQLLERGVSADLLGGQFAAVRRLEGDNTAGIIERFKNMYGLNYHGATQVWAMQRDAWDSEKGDWKEGYSYESNAAEIERMKVDPKYQSDSEKLQTSINKMTENLVNIGQFKFNETEWGILEAQAMDVAAIRGSLENGQNQNQTEELLNAALLSPDGSHIITSLLETHFGGATHGYYQNLLALSDAATQSGDYNNQLVGARFNSDILPSIATMGEGDFSTEIIELIYELQRQHVDATSFFSEGRGRIGTGEFETLNNTMTRLIEALNRNTHSTDENTDTDTDINVNVIR